MLDDSTIRVDNRLDSLVEIKLWEHGFYRIIYKITDSINIKSDSTLVLINRNNEYKLVKFTWSDSTVKILKKPIDSTLVILADSYYAIRYNDFFHRKITIGEDYNYRKHFFDKSPELKSAILMKDDSGIKIIWKNGKSEFLNRVK